MKKSYFDPKMNIAVFSENILTIPSGGGITGTGGASEEAYSGAANSGSVSFNDFNLDFNE